MNELVSIVIPIYNVERYLDRCVQSATNQTYKNLEIILVDDGSPDHCPAICDAWAQRDSRIKVIHKENAGLGEARNTGVRYATGKYLFFWDSDDYVACNTVEKCVCTAQEFGVDTVVYGRNSVYPDGTVKEEANHITKSIYEGQEIINDFLPGLFNYGVGFGVSACGKMFSTHIFKDADLRFESERAVISEDAVFSLEYFAVASKVAVIPDKLYFYFRNDKSLTRAFKEDRQLKNNAFLQKCIDKARTLGLPAETAEHIKARYHGMTLGTMLQIVRAELPSKEKRKKLRSIYKDNVLRETLTFRVIRLDAFFPRVFWLSLKCRCYFLCNLFLLCKGRS